MKPYVKSDIQRFKDIHDNYKNQNQCSKSIIKKAPKQDAHSGNIFLCPLSACPWVLRYEQVGFTQPIFQMNASEIIC